MRIVVSDTSCLIDLRKTVLLETFARLPYEILIPDILFEQEFVKFTQADRDALTDNCVQIVELPESGVLRVLEIQKHNPALSIHDCFAFVLAEQHSDCILLTGDKALRSLADQSGIEVHGVLWVISEIHRRKMVTTKRLIKVLTTWENDETVRLPMKELRNLIRKFEELL